MKKKIIIVVVILFVLMLIPIPLRLKDGGSVEYNAVLYQYVKIHRLSEKSITGYEDGWELKIIGIHIGGKVNKYSLPDESNNKSSEVISSMRVTINKKQYIVNLENNETVKNFITRLPQTFDMNELNGNEKYVYLDYSLPTNALNPKRINKGDVMLYGDNCLVIFYKSFNTSYSYTKIGHIDDLDDLGKGDITVSFEK